MKRLKDIFHILGCVSFHSPPPHPPPKSRVFPEPVTNGYGTEFKFKILKLASLIGSTLIHNIFNAYSVWTNNAQNTHYWSSVSMILKCYYQLRQTIRFDQLAQKNAISNI